MCTMYSQAYDKDTTGGFDEVAWRTAGSSAKHCMGAMNQ
jgi:hypothetical protein